MWWWAVHHAKASISALPTATGRSGGADTCIIERHLALMACATLSGAFDLLP